MNVKKAKLPLVLGGILTLLMIGSIVVVAMVLAKAGPKVENLTITNITDTSASIVWTTSEPTLGTIYIVDKPQSWSIISVLGKKAFHDDRNTQIDEDGERQLMSKNKFHVHHVTVTGLEPESEYYIGIANNKLSFHHDKTLENMKIETSPTLDYPVAPNTVYGKVVDTNNQVINDGVALVKLIGKDTKGESTHASAPIASNGTYTIDIANLRTQDLNVVYKDSDTESEIITILAGNEGTHKSQVDPNLDQPVPDIKIMNKTDIEVIGSESRKSLILNTYASSCCFGNDCADFPGGFDQYCNPQGGWAYERGSHFRNTDPSFSCSSEDNCLKNDPCCGGSVPSPVVSEPDSNKIIPEISNQNPNHQINDLPDEVPQQWNIGQASPPPPHCDVGDYMHDPATEGRCCGWKTDGQCDCVCGEGKTPAIDRINPGAKCVCKVNEITEVERSTQVATQTSACPTSFTYVGAQCGALENCNQGSVHSVSSDVASSIIQCGPGWQISATCGSDGTWASSCVDAPAQEDPVQVTGDVIACSSITDNQECESNGCENYDCTSHCNARPSACPGESWGVCYDPNADSLEACASKFPDLKSGTTQAGVTLPICQNDGYEPFDGDDCGLNNSQCIENNRVMCVNPPRRCPEGKISYCDGNIKKSCTTGIADQDCIITRRYICEESGDSAECKNPSISFNNTNNFSLLEESQPSLVASILGKASAQEVGDSDTGPGVYRISVDGYEVTTSELKIVDFDEDGNPVILFFMDANGNGIKDEGEEFLDISIDLLSVSKEESGVDFRLKTGWNLLSFPVLAKNEAERKASGVLKVINESGIRATQMSGYINGNWRNYTFREDTGEIYGDDFEIVPGEAYFIRSFATGSFLIVGNEYDKSVPVDLVGGWNLVGVISPQQEYTAEGVLDALIANQISADTVSDYQDGMYQNVIKQEGLLYGFDYPIYSKKGYFVRVEDGVSGKWTP